MMPDRRSVCLGLGAVAILRPTLSAAAIDAEHAFRALIAGLGARGGGSAALPATRLVLHAPLWLPPNTTLDLADGELVFELSHPLDRGLCLSDNCHVHNGRIRIISQGSPSAQGQVHAPLSVGQGYEDAPGTPGGPVSGWSIERVILSSDKWARRDDGAWVGAPGIQIIGAVDHGVIRNVTVPDSERMLAGIMIDWGRSGSIAAADDRANQENNTRLFADGSYTTHPQFIDIAGVTIGRLTAPATVHPDTGSFGIRISGAAGITVRDVQIGAITRAALLHSVGDLGSEYARPAERARIARGIVVDNLACDDCTTGALIDCDGRADNIARAQLRGFRPTQATIGTTDMRVSNARGSSNYPEPRAGVVVRNQAGGIFTDISVAGFAEGFRIDEAVTGVTLVRPDAQRCRARGIAIGHWLNPPRDIRVVDPRCADNGTGRDQGNVGILIENSRNVVVSGGIIGAINRYDHAQRIGVHVADGAVGTALTDIRIASSRAGDGVGIAVLFGEAYNLIALVRGNHSEPRFVVTPRAGLELLPVDHAGTTTVYTSPPVREADLSGLTVCAGDTIRFERARPDGARALRALRSGRIGSGTTLLAAT